MGSGKLRNDIVMDQDQSEKVGKEGQTKQRGEGGDKTEELEN